MFLFDFSLFCFSLQTNDTTNTILDLAKAPPKVFELMKQLYFKYTKEKLYDTKLKRGEQESGPDCKAGNFSDFVKTRDTQCQVAMLQEVVSGMKSLVDFKAECENIKKRQNAQRQFLRDTGCESWEEATRKFPLHTSLEAMDRFHGVNFQRGAPHVWSDHVKAAKQYRENQGMMVLKRVKYFKYNLWMFF